MTQAAARSSIFCLWGNPMRKGIFPSGAKKPRRTKLSLLKTYLNIYCPNFMQPAVQDSVIGVGAEAQVSRGKLRHLNVQFFENTIR